MHRNSRYVHILLSIVSSLTCALSVNSANGQTDKATESPIITAAQGAVDATQNKLTKFEQLYKNGVITAGELEQARVELAEARIRLYRLKKDRTELIKQLGVLLTIRKRQMDHANELVNRNVLNSEALEQHRLNHAQVQIRLGLQTTVLVRETQLARMLEYQKRKRVDQKKVDEARENLSQALARLRLVAPGN